MKKLITFLLACYMLISCSTNKSENSTTAENKSMSDETEATQMPTEIGPLSILDVENFKIYEPGDTAVNFPELNISSDSLDEQRALEADLRVSRVKEGIRFKLKNGETKLLLENKRTDGDDYLSFVFQLPLDAIGQWLLMGGYYESLDYILIDQQDGTENHLWGYPVLSPDKKYFLSSMVDLEAGFVPNGIQLWSIEDYKPALLWQTELTDWGSDKLIWTANNSILAEQTYRDDASGELKTRIIKMHFVQDIE